jgi:hypothetical protein
MKRLALRSMFAFAMVTCLLSSTQAGIIPWVYDTIFGPVRYPAYGPGYGYAASYGPQMGSGYSPNSQCSPCAANRPVSPCASGRCSTGGCPTTVAYYPTWPVGYRVVNSQCSPCSTKKTDWRASNSTEGQAPEPRDDGKTTFAEEEVDPFGAQKPPRPLAEETPVRPESKTAPETEATPIEATAATEAETEDTSVTEKIKKDGWEETSKKTAESAVTGEKPATAAEAAATAAAAEEVVAPAAGETEEKPGETLSEDVTTPLIGEGAEVDDVGVGKTTREGEATETPADAKDSASGEATPGEAGESGAVTPLEVTPLESEQDKTSWKISSPVRRIAFRASFRNVQVARVSRPVESDYVIPAASLTRIAER